jgi:hypothetical protein
MLSIDKTLIYSGLSISLVVVIPALLHRVMVMLTFTSLGGMTPGVLERRVPSERHITDTQNNTSHSYSGVARMDLARLGLIRFGCNPTGKAYADSCGEE